MNPIESTGCKKVKEAVTISVLITLGNALVAWGVETVKAEVAERRKRQEKEDADKALERKAREALEAARQCARDAAQQDK